MRCLREPITSHEIRVWRSAKRPIPIWFLSLSLSLFSVALLPCFALLYCCCCTHSHRYNLPACMPACLLFLSPSKSDFLAWILPILKIKNKSRPESNFVLRRILNFLSRDLRNLASMAMSEAFGRFT